MAIHTIQRFFYAEVLTNYSSSSLVGHGGQDYGSTNIRIVIGIDYASIMYICGYALGCEDRWY